MAEKKKPAETPVGKKIRKARTERKIKLDTIANETGFSIDYLKEIEAGKKMPSVGMLLQISRVLKIDSDFLLKEDADNLKKRVKAYQKRTDNYAYETLTPGAENKHLKAFRVTIDPMQDHEGVGYCHEGEEFVYVLSGKIEILVGDHKNVLKTGETLHFNSGIRHLLRNIGKEQSELLVIISGP